MPELFVKDYLNKITLLENQIGMRVSYGILEPFPLTGRDVLGMEAAGKRIAEFIGLDDLVFIVALAKQEEGVAGHIDLANHGKNVFVEISEGAAKYEEAILAILAHEITHKYMQINGISCGTELVHKYENEVFTDITSVFLGFGKLMLNGCEAGEVHHATYGFNTYSTAHTFKTGYLSRDQLAFVYELICTMRKVSKRDIVSNLSKASLSAIRICKRQYDSYFNRQLHDMQFSNELVETLMKDVRNIQSILDQLDKLLRSFQKDYVLKAETFLAAKRKAMISLENNLEFIRQKAIHDPCLSFLKNIGYRERIGQVKGRVNQDAAKATRLRKELERFCKSVKKENLLA